MRASHRHALRAVLLSCLAATVPASVAAESARVVHDGATRWRVYVPETAGAVERFAAAELRKYVRRMTGVALAETSEAGAQTIHVGVRADLGDASLPPPKPGFDGYSISVSSERIVLAGENPRGVLYAVYDLLERAGCRWWQPTLDPKDPEVVPKRTEVTFEEGQWSESARIGARTYNGSAFFFWIHCERILPQIDWAAKNRFNFVGWQPSHEPGSMQNDMEKMRECGALAEMDKRGLGLHGPFHSFVFFLPAEKYFAAHPDWFGMVNGKRRPYASEWPSVNHCWSNAEANAEFIRNAEAFVAQWPQVKILNVTSIDGGTTCQCPTCAKTDSVGLLVDLFNRLADRLAKSAPGVQLESAVGYKPVLAPPKPGDPIPNGRWQALYAHWGRSLAYSYSDLDYAQRPNLLVWKSFFPKFDVCSYYGAASHQPFVALPFLHALEGDARFLVDTGVAGHYVLQFPHGFWWNQAFSVGAAGKYAYYYPERTPEAELRDYALTYFGDRAGPLILEYLQMLGADENLERSYRTCDANANKGDMDWFRDLGELRARAATLASGDPVVSYRLAKLGAAPEFLSEYGTVRWKVTEIERLYTATQLRKATVGEVRKRLDDLRALLARLKDQAADLEARYPGTLAGEWVANWALNRVLGGPLDALENKLEGRPDGPAPARPPYVAGPQ